MVLPTTCINTISCVVCFPDEHSIEKQLTRHTAACISVNWPSVELGWTNHCRWLSGAVYTRHTVVLYVAVMLLVSFCTYHLIDRLARAVTTSLHWNYCFSVVSVTGQSLLLLLSCCCSDGCDLSCCCSYCHIVALTVVICHAVALTVMLLLLLLLLSCCCSDCVICHAVAFTVMLLLLLLLLSCHCSYCRYCHVFALTVVICYCLC